MSSELIHLIVSAHIIGSLELTIGIIHDLTPKMDVELALSEDLTRTVPDFNVQVRFTYAFE
ncbi:MAG: hypothetical protein HKM93_10260 [Desulfobacteraceae bacterium]|nr:hypothetical protein [Desulfobacteraceae bacterium]